MATRRVMVTGGNIITSGGVVTGEKECERKCWSKY